MKLNDIQSKALLPRFASGYAWVQNAFDTIVKKIFERAKSIDAPMTMESIQALNEAELQALYEQYGIAEYYPDLSRETRDNMLYEMCRIYRYLGTPKAVEILCRYIFDGTPLDVTVLDNLAFDDNGNLIDATLLDIFDIAINPQDAVLDEWAHNRILANIIRFSRNSQALRDIYYDYIEQFDLPVYMGLHSLDNPVVIVDWENDDLAKAPEFNFIVIDNAGQIISGSTVSGMEYGTVGHVLMPEKESDMVYGTVGHVTMDDAKQMITVYETGVRTESFYFTTNGRNETQNTNISFSDIPVYNEDGTAPAADTPYDVSPVIAFMDVDGNTKQSDGEILYVANDVLRLDAPDTDEGEQWSALVEYIEPTPLYTEYALYKDSGNVYLQTGITSSYSGQASNQSLAKMYQDSGLTQPLAYDSSKRYVRGTYTDGVWVEQVVQSVSDMPSSTVSSLDGSTRATIAVNKDGYVYLWAITNMTTGGYYVSYNGPYYIRVYDN